ncbi:hypothetical protein AYO46_05345 [Betaproteobacteria bacterium SCGC AG-212-J23]|nr:hypothetical protein AYO46_05345 [Betaproteobacteria bacterium SCGC AG-212-J23]
MKPSAIAIAGLDDASSPTGDVTASLSLMGGWKPITANSFRLHSGSGLSGRPPSEPFSFLKRATRFSIASRLQFLMSRQSFIFVLRWGNVIFSPGG